MGKKISIFMFDGIWVATALLKTRYKTKKHDV